MHFSFEFLFVYAFHMTLLWFIIYMIDSDKKEGVKQRVNCNCNGAMGKLSIVVNILVFQYYLWFPVLNIFVWQNQYCSHFFVTMGISLCFSCQIQVKRNAMQSLRLRILCEYFSSSFASVCTSHFLLFFQTSKYF